MECAVTTHKHTAATAIIVELLFMAGSGNNVTLVVKSRPRAAIEKL